MRRSRKRRLGLLLRWILGAGLVGVLVLNIRSVRRAPPVVQVGCIKPAMNFSTVRVQGVLASDARLLHDGTVLYMVDDGTGTLAVFLGQAPAGNLPRVGSRIAATGSLSVGAGHNIRMRARSADDIVLEPGEASGTFLADLKLVDITPGQQGGRMTVYGTVSKVWNPPPGSKAPHRIVLSDPSGSLEVVHWFEPERIVALGDELAIKGTVEVYKGRLQLKAWEAADVRPFESPPAEIGFSTVSGIGPEMEKSIATVEGRLGEPRAIPRGVIYPLDDGTGTIAVLFWDRNVSGEERDALDEGVRVRVTAPVAVYKGTLELVPKDVGAFQVLE